MDKTLKNKIEEYNILNQKFTLRKLLPILFFNVLLAYLFRSLAIEYLKYFNIVILPNSFDSFNLVKFSEVCILAPILEEVLFRFPLVFCGILIVMINKHVFISKICLFILYVFISIFFGYLHISNYIVPTNLTYIDKLVITSPQIVGGFFLGYTALKFESNIQASIILHALYNFCALIIGLLIDN